MRAHAFTHDTLLILFSLLIAAFSLRRHAALLFDFYAITFFDVTPPLRFALPRC